MRPLLAVAATGALAILLAAVGLWLRNDYRQEKIATLEAPFRSSQIGIRGAGQPARVVFFGDSRVANWDLSPLSSLGPILNAGFGGDTLAGLAARLGRDVLASGPEVVVFLGGINDLTAQSMLDEPTRSDAFAASLAHLDDIVARLRERNIELILLLVSPPLDLDLRRRLVWGSGIEAAVDELNAHLRRLEGPGIRILDSLDVFAASGADWPARVRKDPLHYTPEAYRLLTNAISRKLEATR